MKNRYRIYKILYLPLLLVCFNSCYSPKSDVEEDKYPQIPEFPKFENNSIALQKVTSINTDNENSFYYLISDNTFYIYTIGKQDINDDYNSVRKLLVVKDGILTASNAWKDNLHIHTFIDSKHNLYAGKWRFYAPDYTKKDSIPFLRLDDIAQKYQDSFHVGESERDSLLWKKIYEEQTDFQKKTFASIREMHQISSYFSEKDEFELNNSNVYHICNLYSGLPFYIDDDLFDNVALKVNADYQVDSSYLKKAISKLKFIANNQKFKDEIDSSFKDFTFLKKTDEIVVGNVWFSSGNHFVASFGYHPIYMYYYDVKYKNKKTRTKVNHLHQSVSDPIKAGNGIYFLTWNYDSKKMFIYYLNNSN